MTPPAPDPPASVRSVAVTGGGTWRVDPRLREALLTADGPPLTRWHEQGRLTVVKAGRHRTVWRARLPTGPPPSPGGDWADEVFYLKIEHGDPARRAARHAAGPGRAFREAVAADRVRAAGVETVTPALVGRTPWRGLPEPMRLDELRTAGPAPCGVLLTRAVEPAVALADVLVAAAAGRVPGAVRRAVTRAAARLTAKLHAAGLFPGDFHPGNLLLRGVRADSRGGFRLERNTPVVAALIDLHPLHARRGWPGAARRAAGTLAMFAHGTALFTTAADRVRFLKTYRETLGVTAPGGAWRGWVDGLERRRAAESRRRHARRDRHWRRGCRGFRAVPAPGGTARFVTALDPATAAAFLEDSTAAVLPLLGGDLSKTAGPRLEPVRVLSLSAAEARRGWELGHALLRRGVPVAEPLLCRERGAEGLLVLAGERTAAAPTAGHLRAARRACAALRSWGYTADDAAAAAFLFDRRGVRLADPHRLRPARRREPAPAPTFSEPAFEVAAAAPRPRLRRAA